MALQSLCSRLWESEGEHISLKFNWIFGEKDGNGELEIIHNVMLYFLLLLAAVIVICDILISQSSICSRDMSSLVVLAFNVALIIMFSVSILWLPPCTLSV